MTDTLKARPMKRGAWTCDFPTDETAHALRIALALNPHDTAAQAALGDRYRELGESERTADVWVTRAVRWGACKTLLEGTGKKSSELRRRVRGAVGCTANSVPILLVGGTRSDEAPAMTGDPPETTFKNGGACQYPGAARRAGYKVKYHPDTREITVGVAWLAKSLGV